MLRSSFYGHELAELAIAILESRIYGATNLLLQGRTCRLLLGAGILIDALRVALTGLSIPYVRISLGAIIGFGISRSTYEAAEQTRDFSRFCMIENDYLDSRRRIRLDIELFDYLIEENQSYWLART